ncbi:MAG: hypothetical protein ABSE46_21660 [Terracidiphilus sp.]|jgi:hypothetical protein
MAHISEAVEIKTQTMLPRSTSVIVENSVIYTSFFFFRYVEGSRHITGECEYRFIGKPDRWYWLPGIVRELFAPRKFVVVLDAPVCWDNEDAPIPEARLMGILARIETALQKKYRKHAIEIGTGENNERRS